jgi:hypothetical protein
MNELIYLVPAIISPFIAIITVYLEYRKDQREKLQDRKDFWLRQHYKDLSKELKSHLDELNKHDDIPIYGPPLQIIWTNQDSSAKPGYKIQNKLNNLMEGDLAEHLKAYSLYGDILRVQRRTEEYKLKLEALYESIADNAKELTSKKLAGFKSVVNLPDDYEGYKIDTLIEVLIEMQFLDDWLYVTNPYPAPSLNNSSSNSHNSSQGSTGIATYYYTLDDNLNHMGLAYSKDKKTVEAFKSDIVPELSKAIKQDLDYLVSEKHLIDVSLGEIKKGIAEIINNMNIGIRIDGECRTCKKVLSIKNLKDLEFPT